MGKSAPIHGIGAALEKIVLYNSIPLFREGVLKIHKPNEGLPSIPFGKEESCLNRLCWWSPSEDSIPVEFCRNSSIHGLSFIGRPKLHLSERIFWTIAFLLGVVAAIYLINDVWQRYYQNPVIVAFQAQEVDIDTVPFPSVTICSMNAFPKSEVKRLIELARKRGSAEARAAREALKYAREICHSQRSFSKEFHYAYNRGEENINLGWNDTIPEDAQTEIMDFLLKHTIPCENIIRLCMFSEQPIECGTIFKPLITDYGKCCTFNILPLPLLINDPQIIWPSVERTPALGNLQWTDEELGLWHSWNYDKDGFVLSNKSQPRPFRQKRAGMPYGLSILLDPNINDWYCPVSDSEGFRFVLHNSLEMPYVDEFASLIQLDQEIMVEIHPEMTNADDDIRDFERNARNCYFPEEIQLQFYGPYTAGNCLAECTALVFERKCNCTYFYMPRNDNVGICNSDRHSIDYKCMSDAKIELLDSLKTQCPHCDSLCENIEYHFETTTAKLQDQLKLWNDPDPEHYANPPAWAKNKMSIIHIFMGSETIVPKLRKRLYGTTDLIANTGGLLGLCLGFSVLSAMEFLYFLTLRTFWRICWKKMAQRNKDQRKPKPKHNFADLTKERIIQLNPNQIPLVHFPVHTSSKSYPVPHSPCNSFLMEKKEL